MLLERKEIKLPQDLGSKGQHSLQTNNLPPLDIYQRVFQNTLQKIQKSARRQQNECQTCASRDSAPRRKSVEVSLLNDSMARLHKRPKAHESERKIESASGGKRQNSKFKLKIVPSADGTSLSARRKSWDSDPGHTVVSFQCITHSAMRDSIDEDYLGSEASSSDRSIVPGCTQRIRANNTSISELKSERDIRFHYEDPMISGVRHNSSTNSLDTRALRKNTQPCQFKLHYPCKSSQTVKEDTASELSLSSNESEQAKSQGTKRSPSIHSQDYKIEKLQATHQPSNFRLHNDGSSLHKATEALQQIRKKQRRCLIMPNNPLKLKWDLFLSILIVITSIYTPYRLAFIESNSSQLLTAELVIDGFFLIDIILTFCSAYYDEFDVLIDRRRTIMCRYLKFWFYMDLISVIPVSLIVDRAATVEMKDLARIMRITRMHKMIKMVKLFRMMRIIKQRAKIRKFVNYMIKSTINMERLVVFFLIFLVLCHVAACLWYLIAKLEDFSDKSWVVREGFQNESDASLYMIGFYFTITSITTVGYGDVSAGTFWERLFCVCLMLVGAISYSFAISSFTSAIASSDSRASKLKDKLNILDNIRCEYQMDFEMYWKLRQSLYYDHSKDMTDKMSLLDELPLKLRVGLSDIMYRKHVKGIQYFQGKSAHFMAAVGPLLRPVIVQKGEFIYMEGDPIDALYFVKKGQLGYLKQNESPPDLIYQTVTEGSYFGDVDFLYHDSPDPRRNFSIKALSDKTDLYQIGVEFKKEITELFFNSANTLKDLQELKTQVLIWYNALLKEPKQDIISNMRQNSPKKGQSLFYNNAGRGIKKAFTVIQEGEEMDAENDNNEEDSLPKSKAMEESLLEKKNTTVAVESESEA